MNTKPTAPLDDEAILKVLQYEGKETLLAQVKLGSEIFDALDTENNSPSDILDTMTSLLGFLIMRFTSSSEARGRVIAIICTRLLKNSNITQEELASKYTELKDAGLL